MDLAELNAKVERLLIGALRLKPGEPDACAIKLILAAGRGRVREVTECLQAGVEARYVDYALFYSVQQNQAEVAALLLAHGAKVQPGVLKVCTQWPKTKIIRPLALLLLQHGADIAELGEPALSRLNLSNTELKAAARRALAAVS